MTLRLPAEWEPQSGVMLTWPHAATDWLPYLNEVEPVYIEITRTITQYEKVIVVCHDTALKSHVENVLKKNHVDTGRCHLYIAPSNDSWARDHGPITLLDNQQPHLLDFVFNGWGNKYKAELDNQISKRLHEAGAFGHNPLKSIDFVLEGGSIETDGTGTLLTTTSCLLSSQRNSGLTQIQIEQKLREYLQVDRVLWLEHGQLQGDDTDGHIDTIVRFANPDTLIYVASDNTNDPNHAELSAMHAELLRLKQRNGQPYNLISVPSPVITNDEGDTLPASYVNFLIINDAVLVPVYGVNTDKTALKIIGECFADRQVISINCRPLVQQFGSLHCITMHFLRGVIS